MMTTFLNLCERGGFRVNIVVILTLLGISVLCGSIHAQEGYAVRGISFKGNNTFSAATLKPLMETKTVGWFSRLLGKKGSDYSDELMSRDIESVAAFYQREGFLYIKIGPPTKVIDEHGKTVKLTVSLEEGRPIKIGHVSTSIAPSGDLSDSVLNKIFDRIKSRLLLRAQTRFRDSSVILDQILLTRELNNAGYPYADIRSELAVSKPDYTADITWQIESGPRCRLGDVRLLGVSKVPAHVILRQIAFRPGDQFQLRKIDQSQEQVYGLGAFQIATVTPDLSTNRDTITPVEVYVKDAKRFTTRLGLGYGTEDKVRVSSDTRLLGFPGGARRLQLFFKHSYLDPYHVIITLMQPGYPTPRTTLATSPFIWRQREPSFTVNRVGANLGAIHQFSGNLGSSITYSLEHVRVAQAALIQTTDSLAISKLYNKSQIILGSSFDNSAPVFNPRRGFYSINTFTISGLGFGSRTRYTKLVIDVRRYQPLSALVLAARFKLGGIRTFGTESFVPVEERLYSGGSSSVRGWARFDLGPHVAGLPIGGLSLLEGSVEVRYPIIGGISGVVFGDFGNVWIKSYYYQLSDLHYAAGVGIRLATAIGPIRLDVARPVADVETKIQLHISVGHAF